MVLNSTFPLKKLNEIKMKLKLFPEYLPEYSDL